MKTRVFNFYEDPGHGWIKVPRKLCQKLHILPFITGYSYERGEYLYLEEDCDYSTFLYAMKAKGIAFKLKYNHSNKQSKIRSYNPFQAR